MFKTSSRVLALALVVSVGALTATALTATAQTPTAVPQAERAAATDASVITDWNTVAQTTMAAGDTPVPVPMSGLHFGFVSLAMHDAVVAIEGGFEPYNDVRTRAARNASPEVAAATAAYVVLLHYFPAQKSTLRDSYDESLEGLDRNRAFDNGVTVGEAAAAALIDDRKGDGRNATVTFDRAPAPGVWRPTPPPPGFVAAQMGFIRPLVLQRATRFDLDGPPSLKSKRYTKDFTEVKKYGEKDDSKRSTAQTNTALFWSANAFAQYNGALRDAVTRRGYDISESARAFALLNTSIADTQIACWREKFDHPFWRPITAIRLADTDDNRKTTPDRDWEPQLPTPPYPDYPSGHACLTGATTETFAELFGGRSLDVSVPHPTMATRHYDSARALDEETMNARIWLGFHFRTAMTDGNELGHRVAEWIADRHFEPTD
jgi:hypothetical protein